MLSIVEANSQGPHPEGKKQFKQLVLKRLLLNNILLFLIQYSGLNLSNLSSNPSLAWFATGTASAFLFLRGYSVLPGIWLGNFLAYYLAHVGFGFAVASSGVISLQAVLLFWFSCQYISPSLIFYKLRVYGQFVLFTSLLTAITSLALMFLYSSSMPNKGISFTLWLNDWLGNLNAILIFSCAYVTWDAYFSWHYRTKSPHKLLLNTLYTLVVLIALGLAFCTIPKLTFFLALASLVTVGVSASFGWCAAIIALFLSAIVLNFAALEGAPAFCTPFVSVTLLCLQVLLGVQAITGLSIAMRGKIEIERYSLEI